MLPETFWPTVKPVENERARPLSVAVKDSPGSGAEPSPLPAKAPVRYVGPAGRSRDPATQLAAHGLVDRGGPMSWSPPAPPLPLLPPPPVPVVPPDPAAAPMPPVPVLPGQLVGGSMCSVVAENVVPLQ